MSDTGYFKLHSHDVMGRVMYSQHPSLEAALEQAYAGFPLYLHHAKPLQIDGPAGELVMDIDDIREYCEQRAKTTAPYVCPA